METTGSSTLINNIATTIILNFNFQVFYNLLLYSAAATAGIQITSKIIAIGFSELIRILRYIWETKYKDKKSLAISVIKIINEGSTSGWRTKPRNMEHIYFIARLLEGVNKNASNLFDQCISNWQMYAIERQNSSDRIEDIKLGTDMQKKAQEGCDRVQKIVEKWL